MTNHKPLLSIFSPSKATPAPPVSRLARWALTLIQYDYITKYRKTSEHGNADALSHLPNGPDKKFDTGEDGADTGTVCTIRSISSHLQLHNPNVRRKETAKTLHSLLHNAIAKNAGQNMKPNRHVKLKQHRIHKFKLTSALLRKSRALSAVKMGLCRMVPESSYLKLFRRSTQAVTSWSLWHRNNEAVGQNSSLLARD